jgi:hypothetical protein
MIERYFPAASVKIGSYLGSGDLIAHRLSSRYSNPLWHIAQRLYPRWFIRHVVGDRFGTTMTITARK